MRRVAVIALLVLAWSWIGQGTSLAVTSNGRVCTKVGTAGYDRLVGTSGNDVLCGMGGNDLILGGSGNDWIDGGTGDDVLRGGPGADLFVGGGGVDTVTYDERTTPVTVSLDGFVNDGSANEGDGLYTDIENVTGGRANDVLFGSAGSSVFNAGPGNDVIVAGRSGGRDVYVGGAGLDLVSYADRTHSLTVTIDDRADDGDRRVDNVRRDVEAVIGGKWHDTLIGSSAANALWGGPGDDVLQGLGGADHLDGEAGRDTVTYAEKTSAVYVRLDAYANDGTTGELDELAVGTEIVVGSAHDDMLIGSAAVDTLRGEGGNDHLLGLGGADRVEGGPGNDYASGGEGNDVVYGGDGNDTLRGFGGKDKILGQLGVDWFEGGGDSDFCFSDVADSPVPRCEAAYTGDYYDTPEDYRFVEGTVRDATGAPLAGAVVHGLLDLTTGDDGSFVTLAGQYDGVFVDVPLATGRSARFRPAIAFGTDTRVDLTLPPLHTFTVSAVDALGNPLTATASFSTADGNLPTPRVMLTPELPDWYLEEDPPAGAATGSQFSTYGLTTFRVTVSSRNDVVGWVFSSNNEPFPANGVIARTLEMRPATLNAKVVDASGTGVAGVPLTYSWSDIQRAGTTASDGSLTWDLPRQSGTVRLTVPGTSPALVMTGTLSMVNGDRSLTFTIPDRLSTTVRVVDHTGAPLPGASVGGVCFCNFPGAVPLSGVEYLNDVTTDANGVATVMHFAPGSRTLNAHWMNTSGITRYGGTTNTGSNVQIVIDTR